MIKFLGDLFPQKPLLKKHRRKWSLLMHGYIKHLFYFVIYKIYILPIKSNVKSAWNRWQPVDSSSELGGACDVLSSCGAAVIPSGGILLRIRARGMSISQTTSMCRAPRPEEIRAKSDFLMLRSLRD